MVVSAAGHYFNVSHAPLTLKCNTSEYCYPFVGGFISLKFSLCFLLSSLSDNRDYTASEHRASFHGSLSHVNASPSPSLFPLLSPTPTIALEVCIAVELVAQSSHVLGLVVGRAQPEWPIHASDDVLHPLARTDDQERLWARLALALVWCCRRCGRRAGEPPHGNSLCGVLESKHV